MFEAKQLIVDLEPELLCPISFHHMIVVCSCILIRQTPHQDFKLLEDKDFLDLTMTIPQCLIHS